MIAVVTPDKVDEVVAALAAEGENVITLGRMVRREGEGVVYQGTLAL